MNSDPWSYNLNKSKPIVYSIISFIFLLKFIVSPSYFAKLPYDNLFKLLLLLIAFSLWFDYSILNLSFNPYIYKPKFSGQSRRSNCPCVITLSFKYYITEFKSKLITT